MKHTNLPIELVKFDPKNPRLGDYLKRYDTPTDERVAMALGVKGGKQGYEKLKESIMNTKGIIDPIKVISSDSENEFICIDGNTRLSVYKTLAKADSESDLWTSIPAIICDKNDTDLINTIRIAAHMVGAREWEPYEKARYLYDLRYEQHMSMAAIMEIAGLKNSTDLEANIDAFLEMNQHYRDRLESEQDFKENRFSGFVELQKGKTKEAISAAGLSLDDFGDWIHYQKIYPLNKVRVLSKILNDKEATEIFLGEGFNTLQEAERHLEDKDPLINITKHTKLESASLAAICSVLKKRLKALSWEEQEELLRPDTEAKQLEANSLSDVAEIISRLLGQEDG